MHLRAVGILVLCSSVFGATEWSVLKTPNFELITDAGAGDGRRVVEYFEQVRGFFTQARAVNLDSKLPVTIILFRNRKEFLPYSPGETAAAFYAGDESRDYIVMASSADDERPVAVHEYMHLLVRRLDVKLPAWLDEGVAEVYSTIRPYAGKIAVGAVAKGRTYALALDSWLPTDRLFSVRTGSEDYSGKKHGGVFYGQSWLAVHMLMLSKGYGEKFGEFLNHVSGGMDSAQALDKVYGKSVPDFTRDLQAYYRSDRLNAMLFDTKFAKIAAPEAEKAEEFVVDLHLARILASGSRREEAESRLRRLATTSPDRWEVHDALGQVAWRKGQFEQAVASFRAAVEKNPPQWNVYWDYARVAHGQSEERERVAAALRKGVSLNPAHVEMQLLLGEHLSQMEKFEEALGVLDRVSKVTPDRAPRLFLAKCYVNLRLRKWEEARLAGLTALKYAIAEPDKGRATELLAWLRRRQEAEARGAQVAEARPAALEAVVESTQSRAADPVFSRVAGTLERVDCETNSAVLHVRTGEGKTVRLQIADPDKITIRNQPGSSVNLSCGAQQPSKRVAVEFVDRVEKEIVGEVRAVEFLSN